MLNEIVKDFHSLVQDQYGNYVIQVRRARARAAQLWRRCLAAQAALAAAAAMRAHGDVPSQYHSTSSNTAAQLIATR